MLADEVYICDSCGVGYHQECYAELGSCATLGCEASKQTVSNTKLEPETKVLNKFGVGATVVVFILACYALVYGLLFLRG